MASMYFGTILMYFYELRRPKLYLTIFGQNLETLAMVWWVVQYYFVLSGVKSY